ncbi:MAG: tRNA glutamyl-Q(34) synthetase GluQRS [Rhizobiales bacterium]|nr:tRNA glutamyl-Q(34) synthetase GluQRS [Hyphomicrobiales bacterium]NRB15669.1 tRNA glutamyl-Q(34) synthetase GluQRS [Hyphomicrobiales bacterium]
MIHIIKVARVQQKLKLRFAPSPNGFLHLGHAYSALLNAQIADALGAEFIIRMEDIDQLRCKATYIDACLEDLSRLGLEFDPEIMHQSQRQAAYAAGLKKLMALGVLYPCLATRGEIKKYYATHKKVYDPDGALIYPQLYKNLTAQERLDIMAGEAAYALRLDMQKARQLVAHKMCFLQVDLAEGQMVRQKFNPAIWGDVIIARKDIGTSYHLSVVVDDAAQGITHIVRGMDLYKATYIHRLLQNLLGLPEPIYHHHQLVEDEAFNKLAKSRSSATLRDYWAEHADDDLNGFGAQQGLLAAPVRANLAIKIAAIISRST